jgi:tRNA(Arg) A34 adenosine deaminase TadA
MDPSFTPEAAFMQEAIAEARQGMHANHGGPFGAVIVRDGIIIGRGHNQVTSTNDPTAHAEIVAIRLACQKLGSYILKGCSLYTSCEPCPMCLSAIYWARLEAIYYAYNREDAAAAGFDDQLIYEQIPLPADRRLIPMHRLLPAEARSVFAEWSAKADRTHY